MQTGDIVHHCGDFPPGKTLDLFDHFLIDIAPLADTNPVKLALQITVVLTMDHGNLLFEITLPLVTVTLCTLFFVNALT